MNRERHERVKEIFFAALELPEAERGRFVDEACGDDDGLRAEVGSLLAHDSTDGGAFAEGQIEVMRDALADAVGSSDETHVVERRPGEAQIPRRVGRYHILRVIGHGGMGVVYEARQDHPHRTVAVKVIRPGLGSERILRRFDQEAEVLGRLQHAGIAHIYEAGVAEVQFANAASARQPFLAMELIRGRGLLEFIREENLHVRRRLELFARICDAVQHAHDAGVIHRDLKPANILIDATGQPKVLDFGVARLTDADVQATTQHTDVGQLIGTLPYMSPEQVVGNTQALDRRSDVYALGVVLYEMLSGALPYDLRTRSVPEAIRLIQTVEPSRLSAVNTVFRGDIETIVAKALEKDRDRRYESAAELAADLRRYLANQPIAARPASSLYQFRKFARRNKAAVVATVVVFVALVVGVIATSAGMIRARRAETQARFESQEAKSARREAEAVNAFLADMLAGADPAQHGGREMTVREMLDEAATRVGEYGDGTPQVTSAIEKTIGKTYQQIGEYREAVPHFEKAFELRDAAFGRRDENTQISLADLCVSLFLSDELEEAEKRLAPAIAALRAGDPDFPDILGRQLHTLGRVRSQRGDYAATIDLYQEAADILRRGGSTAGGLANVLSDMGNLLSRESRHAEAEAAFREALEINRINHGPRSAYVGDLLNNLAVATKRQGKLEEAEKLYREALEIQRATHGVDHPLTHSSMINLGALLAQEGEYVEAEALLREALGSMRRLHGNDSTHVGVACGMLADALRMQGKLDEAEGLARESVSIFRSALGEAPYTATGLSKLGDVQFDRGAFAEAAASYKEASEIYRKTLGADHAAVGDMWELYLKARKAAENITTNN